MAQTGRTIPHNFPQPLGTQLLKADAHRQVSMLRQEFATDLLAVLTEARETAVRQRLTRLVQSHLKTSLAAASKAEDLWPALDDVKQVLAAHAESKPAQASKHLKLFIQIDKVHRRSLDLLHGSFENIQLILDRLQPPAVATPPADAAQPAGRGPAR